MFCLFEGSSSFSDICTLQKQHPDVFLEKGALKICSKLTGEQPCRSAISIKLLCNFIEIALWHGLSPVNLLHIFRTPSASDSLICENGMCTEWNV